MMSIHLQDIADVSSGQTFRGKIRNNPDGTVWAIQMRDINTSYTGLQGDPFLIRENEASPRQLLKKGDVLFTSKGNSNKAIVFDHDHPAVASSMLTVIRPDRQRVLPGYLAWYLNSETAQGQLHALRSGATVLSISVSDLRELEIPLPNMKEQEIIAKVYQLAIKEQELINELAQERKQFIQTTLQTILDR